MQFSKEKKQNINNKQKQLTQLISEEKLKQKPNQHQIQVWQNTLENIENYKKAEGSIIRSKEKFIINEEKPTKYFYQQEQRKQAKKQIIQLQNEQNKLLKTDSEVLKECQNFYQKLYNKQENYEQTQKELLENITQVLENEYNQELTKNINKNELKLAIQQMENDKSPGIDGIPIEFYKKFYQILEIYLLPLYNNLVFIEQKITKTINQAITTLIPKKGNLELIKYWRPISLLCVECKILTKILANRLKKILPNIISEEQNAYHKEPYLTTFS